MGSTWHVEHIFRSRTRPSKMEMGRAGDDGQRKLGQNLPGESVLLNERPSADLPFLKELSSTMIGIMGNGLVMFARHLSAPERTGIDRNLILLNNDFQNILRSIF